MAAILTPVEQYVVQKVDFHSLVVSQGIEQPFDTVKLVDAQLFARWKLKRKKRCILGMDKGMGKTFVVLTLFEDEEVHKGVKGFTVLIVCPEKGMDSYIRDFSKLRPDEQQMIQLVYGSKGQREVQWKNRRARYFICTPATLLSDTGQRTNNKKSGEVSIPIAPKWVYDGSIDAVVLEEFHRYMRRKDSKFFEVACKLFKHTQYVIPTSGSVMSKGPQDAWPALHLCDPKMWSSYWKYVNTWCEVEDGMFGKVIGGAKAERKDQWQRAVDDNMIYILAGMSEDMPPKRKDLLDITMEPWQKKLHDDVLTQLYAETEDGEFIFAENSLSKIHLLRTILICPKVLSPTYGVGQGIQDIWEDAFDGGISKYAVFTPFKAPIPHLVDWLTDKGARVWVLQGGIGLEEQKQRLSAWRAYIGSPQASSENPGILISTTKYAESWECPEARYGYMLGCEWDPQDNEQAEDRLRRLISEGMTYIRYTRHLGSYEEDLLDLLVNKNMNVRTMFKDWRQLRSFIQHSTRADQPKFGIGMT